MQPSEPPYSPVKNPANPDISRKFAVSKGQERASIATSRQIDENGSLPYKPRQLSAMTRSDRGGSIGPQMARFGPSSITGLISLSGIIARSAENGP
jgi:hypothetical protein